MSLISSKNFISPFKNSVHIITIVMIALAFIGLRLAGGGFNLRDSSTKNFNSQSKIEDNFKKTRVTDFIKEIDKPVSTKKSNSLFDKIPDPWNRKNKEVKEKKNIPTKESNTSSLDDIERIVGIN